MIKNYSKYITNQAASRFQSSLICNQLNPHVNYINKNKYIERVDHHDWLLEKHRIAIRGEKWYCCLVTRMIDMAMVNACIMYRLIYGLNFISTKSF